MNNREPASFRFLRKQLYMVGNWFFGTLSEMSKDKKDKALLNSLQEWLASQTAKYDELSIGRVCCRSCGYQWDVMLLNSKKKELVCPKCGRNHDKEGRVKRTNHSKGERMILDIPFDIY